LAIEELIGKLRPVLGQKADALLLAYRMNPESRPEIASEGRQNTRFQNGTDYSDKRLKRIS